MEPDQSTIDIYSVLALQGFSVSSVLRASSPEPPKNDGKDDSPNSRDTQRFRSFSTSEFVELLDAVQVPFINTTGTFFGLHGSSPWSHLGEGGFSNVKHDELLGDDTDEVCGAVAVKEFKGRLPLSKQPEEVGHINSTMNSASITQCYTEVCIMKHPRLSGHPNILRLLGISHIRNLPGSPLSFVTEYADMGTFEMYIQDEQRRDEELKVHLLCDINAGLMAMHACDVVHNDVKCSNVLLFSGTPQVKRIVAKLSDFGCSVPLAHSQLCRKAAGTSLFAAPEAYSPECVVRTSRDIYSFGLIIFYAITRKQPFTDIKEDSVWEFKQSPELYRYISKHLADIGASSSVTQLLANMLNAQPEERLSDLLEVNSVLCTSYGCSKDTDPLSALDDDSPHVAPSIWDSLIVGGRSRMVQPSTDTHQRTINFRSSKQGLRRLHSMLTL